MAYLEDFTAQAENARIGIFRRKVGQELREFREAYGLSQEEIATAFRWTKDAMSKIERGERPIDMYRYLRLMQFYARADPDHPAVVLARRMLPGRRLSIQGIEKPHHPADGQQ
jgi:transcriptional regulator with XRE-family HTH domain